MGGPYGDAADDGCRGLSSCYGGQLCLRGMNLKANSLAWAVHVNRERLPYPGNTLELRWLIPPRQVILPR